MLNITNYWKNANQNYNEVLKISYMKYTALDVVYTKMKQIIHVFKEFTIYWAKGISKLLQYSLRMTKIMA